MKRLVMRIDDDHGDKGEGEDEEEEEEDCDADH